MGTAGEVRRPRKAWCGGSLKRWQQGLEGEVERHGQEASGSLALRRSRPGTSESPEAEADLEGRGGAPQSEPLEVFPQKASSRKLWEASPSEAPGGNLIQETPGGLATRNPPEVVIQGTSGRVRPGSLGLGSLPPPAWQDSGLRRLGGASPKVSHPGTPRKSWSREP